MSKTTRARTTTWRLPGNRSLRWLNRSSRTQALHRSYWSWYRKRLQRDVRSTGAPLVSSHSSSGCDESIGGTTHDDLEAGSYLLPLATHGDACSPKETCLRGGVKRRWQGPPGCARGLRACLVMPWEEVAWYAAMLGHDLSEQPFRHRVGSST